MKKFYLTLFLILFSMLVFSQNYRCTYEYKFKIDSTQRENIQEEIMNLDITKDGSTFYSNEKFIYDSLSSAELKKAVATKSSHINFSKITNKGKINFSVSKKYPELEIVLNTPINGDEYSIKDNQKLEWTILSERKEIGGLQVQKATTLSGGRKWIAWFTTEILFQDGPYKFSGLPGLILNVEDSKGDHSFQFIGIKKLNDLPESVISKIKSISITPQQYKKLWKEYTNDPGKKIREIFSSGDIKIKMTDANGKELSQSEILRNKELRVKESLKKTNNFLDLSLH